MEKSVDLNIDKILEAWSPQEAIRELISNALDETLISEAKEDVKIYKEGENYIIQDYGRGIREEHFIINENREKLENPKCIGKFGFGLKDSIGVLIRNKIKIKIETSHITAVFKRKKKHTTDHLAIHAII